MSRSAFEIRGLSRLRLLVAAVFVALCSGIIGCGEGDRGYVTGTITLDGKPVGPGTIRFFLVDPDDSFAPVPASNFSEDGRFELRLSGSQVGAPPGGYEVTISDKAAELGLEAPGGKASIPPRYQDRKQGGLTATVKPGKQTIDFSLEP